MSDYFEALERKDKNMKQFELTLQHIELLTNAHIRWEDCEYGAPAIDCKRPYGNSFVEQDIAEILGLLSEGGNIDDIPEEHVERCRELHEETETALQIILSAKTFEPGTYVADKYTFDWRKAE